VLRGLLEAAGDGLLALDEHGMIVEANQAAAALLGTEQVQLSGTPLAARFDVSDRRRFRQSLSGLRSGTTKSLQLKLLEGSSPVQVFLHALPVRQRVVAVTLSAGEPTEPSSPPPPDDAIKQFVLRFPGAAVAVRRDLRVAYANAQAHTLLGRDAVRAGSVLGDELGADLKDLAHHITTGSAPLAATEIELADGRALRVTGLAAYGPDPAVLLIEDITKQRRRDRMVREFLRNAAHQLRTPLAGIAAAVETLQAGAKDDPQLRERFLDHVETHAGRLTQLTHGLLTLARAESGDAIPVDAVELQPVLAAAVRDASAGEGVVVRAMSPDGLAAIAVPDLLTEVIAALVENAVAHTVEGEIVLSAVSDGDRVAIRVADSGTGIPPEFRDRVFEPFFRISPSGNGYGLGLAIAAQAVRAMRGEIAVSSTPGQGTVFTITLPSPQART
jgi:signal transduction histidine kinase